MWPVDGISEDGGGADFLPGPGPYGAQKGGGRKGGGYGARRDLFNHDIFTTFHDVEFSV